MAVDIQGKLITRTIGIFDKMVIQNGTLFLVDLDNDGNDEILLNFEIAGNGATITQVFKVENQEINLLIDLSDYDTGYSSKYQIGRKLLIENTDTSYSYSFDISNLFADDFFDEQGLATTNEMIVLSPFVSYSVFDVDNDGVCTLQCEQNVSLVSGIIGKVKTLLQYNVTENQFQVIEAEFKENK